MSDTCKILIVSSDMGELRASITASGSFRAEWSIETAGSPETAWQNFQKTWFDVVVVDSEFGASASLAFLNSVAGLRAETIRYVCGTASSSGLVEDCVKHSHRVFTSVPSAETLREAIEVAITTKVWLLRHHKSLQGLVSRMRIFPSPPTLYFKVVAELKSPKASVTRLVELIQSDLAVTTRIIKVVNLVHYGQQKPVTNLEEAIQILGLETVKSLVLAIQAVVRIDEVALSCFSPDQIWRHAVAVANRAWRIAMLQTENAELADDAFTAGLLHDLGKLLFASNFPVEYAAVFEQARQTTRPFVEVEKELLGVTHAEAGAYLAALWGLPNGIVTAIGWHHNPQASDDGTFTALTALHAANAFEQEEESESDGGPKHSLSMDYLTKIGMSGAVEAWRNAADPGNQQRTRHFASLQNQSKNQGGRVERTFFPFGRELRWKSLAASLALAAGGLFLAQQSWTRIRPAAEGSGSVSKTLPVNARSRPVSVTPQARETENPDLLVTDILLIKGKQPTALINGMAARVGDTLWGVKVLEITEKTVRVHTVTGERTLTRP